MITGKFEPVYFAKQELLPIGFKYPKEYVAFIESSPPTTIGPLNEDWSFIHSSQIESYFLYVKSVSSNLELIPFLRRNGEDGVACFSWQQGNENLLVWYCNVFQNKGCWSTNCTFSEWLNKIPPADAEE